MRLTPPVWRPAAASLRVQQRLPLGGGAAAALAATTGTTRLAPGCIDAELEAFHADFTLSHAASVLMASLETPAGLEPEACGEGTCLKTPRPCWGSDRH